MLAAAVALLGSMLLFVGHSLRTMTGTAIRSVPLDWQGPVGSYAQARSVAASVAAQPGIQQASATATAPFAGASHTGAGAPRTRVPGRSSPLGPTTSPTSTPSAYCKGRLRPGAIVLDQQLAATLQAQIGEQISITPRAGARPQRFPVSGVGLITAPDVVFAPLNPLLGPAPAQPPGQRDDHAGADVRCDAAPGRFR